MVRAIREVVISSWPTLIVLLAIFIIMRATIYFKGESRRLILHEELFNLVFMIYLIIFFKLVTSQDIQA